MSTTLCLGFERLIFGVKTLHQCSWVVPLSQQVGYMDYGEHIVSHLPLPGFFTTPAVNIIRPQSAVHTVFADTAFFYL
jgi:hypothetical protein